MGFETVQTNGRGATAIPSVVTAAIHKSGLTLKDGGHSLSLSLGLGGEVLHRMGVQLGDRVVLEEGTDEDLGYYQLRKAKPNEDGVRLTTSGGRLNHANANTARLAVSLRSLRKCVCTEPRASSVVSHQVFNRVLTLTIPWLVGEG